MKKWSEGGWSGIQKLVAGRKSLSIGLYGIWELLEPKANSNKLTLMNIWDIGKYVNLGGL